MKYSIVITTYNHLDDLLKPCIDSIVRNTILEDIEIIVVANGCTDGTREYVNSLGYPFRLLWFDEPLGYTKAANEGFKIAQGEYIIPMNNDVEILDWGEKNYWLDILEAPFFLDKKVAVTGASRIFNESTKRYFIIFFLAMIKKDVFEKFGFYDETFSPGWGEDIDFCHKIEDAGYRTVKVPYDTYEWSYDVPYPVVHKDGQTMKRDGSMWASTYDKTATEHSEILKQRYFKPIKYSIIIPTYNHVDDLLKPCIESIKANTDLSKRDVEIVVVANGCTDGTREYGNSLGYPFRLLWFDEPLGYTKATNEGIEAAEGEYLILLNNDTKILPFPELEKGDWIRFLEDPFLKDEKMGITGPMLSFCPHAEQDFLIFFCVMIPKKLFQELGLLDEIFSPGFGEDTDFCIRTKQAGYKIKQVPDDYVTFLDHDQKLMEGHFPIFHAREETFKDVENGDDLLRKNRNILAERYGSKKVPDVNIEKALQCSGYMSNDELMWLGKMAQTNKIIIEVGSWHGKSSRAIADNLPNDGKLYCIDHWDGSEAERETFHQSASMLGGDHAYIEFCKNLFDHIQTGKVIPIRMSSKNASAFLFDKVKADLVFIDAGHTYEEVKEDIYAWSPLVKSNGILCGHDYFVWQGVTEAVNEVIGSDISAENTIWIHNKKSEIVSVSTPTGKPLVFDCFPFCNELDILDIRFNELYDVVDRFIITEATRYHGGKPKPLFFNDNLDRYKKFLNKITYMVIDEYPALDSWSIERHQRDSLMKGISDCRDDDIIIIGDADEIPTAESLSKFKPENEIMALIQRFYYYYLNCQSIEPWDWCKFVTYGKLKTMSPCQVRYTPFTDRTKLIQNAGWHFSFLGNIDDIILKIDSTAHQEYNTAYFKDRARLEQLIRAGKDIYDRPIEYKFVDIDDTYPKFIKDNIQIFESKGLINRG